MGRNNKERSRKPKSRHLSKRYSGDRVLIVTEGTETEPNYLHALKEHFKLNKAAIEIVPSSGSAPQTVVRYAKDAIKDACRKGNPFAKVYCVIDKDLHPRYSNALQTIRDFDSEADEHCETALCLISSVPCFEHWILMHYTATTRSYGTGGSSPCGQLISTALRTHVAGYQKADRAFARELIAQRLSDARRNSAITLGMAQSANTDDPSTKMHLLVDDLEHLKINRHFQEDSKGCP